MAALVIAAFSPFEQMPSSSSRNYIPASDVIASPDFIEPIEEAGDDGEYKEPVEHKDEAGENNSFRGEITEDNSLSDNP